MIFKETEEANSGPPSLQIAWHRHFFSDWASPNWEIRKAVLVAFRTARTETSILDLNLWTMLAPFWNLAWKRFSEQASPSLLLPPSSSPCHNFSGWQSAHSLHNNLCCPHCFKPQRWSVAFLFYHLFSRAISLRFSLEVAECQGNIILKEKN